MTNEQLLEKLSQDMKMRNFSHYSYDTYMEKTKEELSTFFKVCDNFKFRTIFMLEIMVGHI